MYIETKLGRINEARLVKKTGGHENDDEIATWQEWWLDGELVKRDVQIELKKWPSAEAAAAFFGTRG